MKKTTSIVAAGESGQGSTPTWPRGMHFPKAERVELT